ncbi:MAG: FAD-dependent oxidoreductase [Atopobiaceae bacterium]|jgi:thioredoxin reductase (NADPH)|nr:FAD-dependent oxidoreductase [Atopobiaceae bacterium]MCH4119267.1 FAD-dependent oxidoreductase [Atopobiaceae bacterium]MCI1318060.1 FAD-dependent oxidoreductase [Atopobiaceae bacterium]MCI1388473.1 FAD-dependent oxidoreductase [Atopobiaceae bacterium]MCI1431972.1 FAD-dependent oxidoreductase [Atopobiaceae bacterium]
MTNEATRDKDLVIIGAGPAGLSASIYASRAMLDFVTLEQTGVGGQVLTTTEVDNYPGVPKADGFTLMDTMAKQAKDLGAQIESDQVASLALRDDGTFDVGTASGGYHAKAVILASGATPRHAGFDGEERFGGHGVSYCGTCDGMFYRNKQVFCIGGGNTAAEDALFLARLASKVTLVVRKDHLRAQASLVRQLEENERVEIRYLTSIVAIDGGDMPSQVTFRDNATGEEHVEAFEEGSFGVFVFVGHQPASSLLGDLAELDHGAVVTDERMATRTPGLFCAGDVRRTPLRQIITAAADGAMAATSASAYLGNPVDY